MDSPSRVADIFIAICYGVCFVVGISGNGVSLRYFLSGPRKLSILLYRSISINDILISIIIFPDMSSIATREPVMFTSRIFCTIWGVCWDVCVYLSTFLVCVMSISRTYTMVFPFRKLDKKKIMIGIVCYIIFLILYRCLLLLITKYVYDSESCFCSSDSRDYEAGVINAEALEAHIGNVLLASPVLPIFISCVISICILNRDIKSGNAKSQIAKSKHKATVTIIIFTLLYTVCNVPVVVLNIYWIMSYKKYPEPYFTSNFMYFYSWHILYILSVCVNSACNPVIYITRNGVFKSHLKRRMWSVFWKINRKKEINGKTINGKKNNDDDEVKISEH